MTPEQVVIVGAGLSGQRTSELLREKGFQGGITLVGAESYLPYDRPPLSKAYLADEAKDPGLHPEQWYADHRIDLRLGSSASAIDRSGHRIDLADGDHLPYTYAVLATGSQPRHLDLPGADARGVLYLRTRDDSDALRAVIGSATRLVVIGGGWIGLEATADARAKGVAVTVLEAGPLPLQGVLGPQMAQVFTDLHREHGVEVRTGVTVEAIETHDGAATGVRLADGTVVPGDAVLVGIGAIPDLELARAAGLDIGRGVRVDAQMRTSDPAIFAVGDIAEQDHPFYSAPVRVEHWANALNQPEAVAAAIVGTPEPYDRLPYFYTDQYDLGMEYVGLVPPGVETTVVTRGDVAAREFIAFWLDPSDRVLAGMNVNVWDVTDTIKELIRSGKPVDPARLADPSVPLGA